MGGGSERRNESGRNEGTNWVGMKKLIGSEQTGVRDEPERNGGRDGVGTEERTGRKDELTNRNKLERNMKRRAC